MPTGLEVLLAAAPGLEEDLLLALRFGYYVKANPLIPDALYDEAEKEFVNRPEFADGPLMQPGSDKAADYPHRIHALWLYLALLREDRRPPEARAVKPAAPPAPAQRSRRVQTAAMTPKAATGELF